MAKARKRTRPRSGAAAAAPKPKLPPRPTKTSLRSIGIEPNERPYPKGDASWWADARDAQDRLEIVQALWRWVAVAGYVPEPEDWDPQQGWPPASEVEALFGSWDKFLEEGLVDEAIVLELVERVQATEAALTARTEEVAARERWLEEQTRKLPELKRQAEAARDRRVAADSERQEAEAARDAALRERDALTARVRELEGALRAAQEEAAAPVDAPDADEALLEEMERTLAAQAATQQQRDELHERLEALRAERERDRRTIAELTRLLAEAESAAPAAAGAPEPEAPPATVLEAVERAAAEATHVRFARRAFESAQDSPFRRPALVLRTLRALEEIAARFAEGEMGVSLGQAAAQHGITQWKPDVAETTRKRYEDDYTVTWDGHRLTLGPHVGLGSGSGAQFVARIYLHVSEGGEIPRGITVGHVGRHLPDTTT